MKLLLLFCFACFIFVAGLVIGTTFFDVHDPTGSAADRPWEALTQRSAAAARRAGGLLRAGGVDEGNPDADGDPDSVVYPEPVLQQQGGGVAAPAAGTPAGQPAQGAAQGNVQTAQEPGVVPATTGGAAAAPATDPPDAAAPATTPAAPPAAPESYVTLRLADYVEIDSPLDGPDVTFAAWIWMDSAETTANIKTIASNRWAGCEPDSRHHGFALYVNEWNTANRALKVDWGNRVDGCSALASDPELIPLDTWTHVGVAFQAPVDGQPGVVMLFKDGAMVKRAHCQRVPQASQGLRIGMHVDDQYGFAGRVAYPIAMNLVVTPEQLAYSMQQVTLAGMQAFAEAAKGKTLALLVLDNDPKKPLVTDVSPAGHRGTPSASMSRPVGLPVPQATSATEATSPSVATETATGTDTQPSVGTPSVVQPPTSNGPPGVNRWNSKEFRMPESMTTGTVDSQDALAAGTFSDNIAPEVLAESDRLGRERAAKVKAAMQHAWKGYKDHAWGADELKPRSGRSQNNWGGMGMTLIDSLDTLWLMGMKDEFQEATEWVRKNLNFGVPRSVSVFETNIRALGGLLAAYDVSKEQVFLDKAKDLGSRLLPAFNTPSGIPMNSVHLTSGQTSNPSWTGSSSILSELGTMQVEFRYLSHASGDPSYGRKAEAVIEKLNEQTPPDGLYPIYINPRTGRPANSKITFGALGDSFYEYLLKVWIQGGKKESMYREMYDRAMDGMTNKLLKTTNPSNLMYVSDWDGSRNEHKMDHLVCFVPGMLALGAYHADGTRGESNRWRDLKNAKALAYTCYQMYDRMATGLSAEYVEFRGGTDFVAAPRAPFYILRPEASESLFILHQLTGNPIYREWGWRMFQAIERYTKVDYGYGAHPDVRDVNRTPDDRMESFFLAETLKYLYLLQSPDHDVSLEKYVFNTEAHPLAVWS